jgi:hypothetical protein
MRSKLVGQSLARFSCAGVVAAATGLVAVLGTTPCAQADIISIQSNSAASTNGLGTFSGTIDYGFSLLLNSWAVTISLTNTSPAANGGYITAFIFNIDSSDPNASATLVSGPSPWMDTPHANGQPYGNPYTAGASIDMSFQGSGGNPNQGIGVGGTGVFTFTVSATDAAALSASSFINGPYPYDFLVRFRGFENHSSDKVPGQIVPGPAVLTAMAFGLAMIGRRRRRLA